MTGIDLTEGTRGGWHIVSIKGRIDSTTAPELSSALLAAVAAYPQVAVDCSDVEYISSAGIASLLDGARAARGSQHQLMICAPNARVKQVFEISRLRDLLNVHDGLPS